METVINVEIKEGMKVRRGDEVFRIKGPSLKKGEWLLVGCVNKKCVELSCSEALVREGIEEFGVGTAVKHLILRHEATHQDWKRGRHRRSYSEVY